MAKRINVLGDIRAESDIQMLEMAFYETPDYRTLIESTDRPIVVGRRGTGKSALRYRLRKFWSKGRDTQVVEIIPEEDQVIGLRVLIQYFGNRFTQIKAGARITWKYALLMEALIRLEHDPRFAQSKDYGFLLSHLKSWRASGSSVSERLCQTVKSKLSGGNSPEERISSIVRILEVGDLQLAISKFLTETRRSIVFLADQLDEGYEPDACGVGLLAGFVQCVVDLNHQVPGIQTYVFIRDNIFKAIANQDPDYSRNIEGRFLRLHWDENQLFDMVCTRLRIAFNIDVDSNRKVWNRRTDGDLQEKSGFEKCLQLTLYRPRDLLSLLNDAFYVAKKQNRETLTLKDIEATAKEISTARLDDLFKEYSAIFPGLKHLVELFRNGNPESSHPELLKHVKVLFEDETLPPPVRRDLEILSDPAEGLKILYSIGFLGIKDAATGSFIFCHDGRSPSREFTPNDRILVHPCYWMGLNVSRNHLNSEESAEIHDEYEVEVYSEAPEVRAKRIGQIIAKLDSIPLGTDGATEFENWSLRAIRIAFSGNLRNIDLHPNETAPQRRDIVGTNMSEKGIWKRIYEDYQTRQVVFEIKNKYGLEPEDYRQMRSYLHDEYGRLGFIITRDKHYELYAGPELEFCREMYNKHRVVIIKVTGSYFYSLLSKLRSPEQKHDPCEVSLTKLVDTYTRLYFSGARIARAPTDVS